MSQLKRVYFFCGQLGLMVSVRFFFQWNLKYADSRSSTDEVLFDAWMVGLLFFGARIFDGVTDPIAGWLSDRWVRWGRERRILLWFSFIIPAIGLVLIFLPSHAMPPSLRWTLHAAGMLIFFVGYTFYAIPYWSLTNDYSGDDHERRRILSTLLGAGLIIATAVVFIVSPLLIGPFGFRVSALVFAIPCAALMVLPIFARPTRGAPRPAGDEGRRESLPKQLWLALKHRRFLAVLLIFSGSQMAFTVITVASPFIATKLLGGDVEDVATITAPFLGAAVPIFIVAPMLSRRFGWQRMVVVASLALAVVYAGAGGLGEAWVGSAMTTAMILF
ncbi:MFS transporter, partial [Myxococcota bacterium]